MFLYYSFSYSCQLQFLLKAVQFLSDCDLHFTPKFLFYSSVASTSLLIDLHHLLHFNNNFLVDLYLTQDVYSVTDFTHMFHGVNNIVVVCFYRIRFNGCNTPKTPAFNAL